MTWDEPLNNLTTGVARYPAILMVIALNTLLSGGLVWYLLNVESYRHKERVLVMERCFTAPR